MAKADISVNVGTKFNNDGLKKLDAATKKAASGAKSAAQAMGSISQELGRMGGAAGKAAQAASGLMGVLTAGGPIAITLAAITSGIMLLVKAFNDAKELAKDAAKSMREGFSKAFEASAKQIDNVKSSLAQVLKLNDQAKSNKSAERSIASRASINATSNLAVDSMARTGDESERARIAALERRDLAIQQAEDKRIQATEDEVQSIKDNIAKIEEARNELRTKLKEQMDALEKERARIEKSGLAAQYEELKRAVANAEKTMREKGADSIVGRETRWTPNAMGGLSSYDVTFTAKDVQENAVKKVKEFEEKNEILIKDLENLHSIQGKFAQSSKAYDDVTRQLTDEQKKLELATKNATVANAEYETAIKRINLKFDEEMKAIDKSLEAQAEADQKEKEAAEKELKAAQEKWSREQEEQDIKRGIENLEIMRQRIIDKDNKSAVERLEERKKEQEAAKKLAEAEKKAAEVLNQWANNPQQGFNAWNNAQKQAARQAEKDAKQQAKNRQQAQDNAKAVAGRIFDANGNIKGGANAFDIGRFAEQADFLGFKNVTDEQLNALRSKRDELRGKLFNADGTLKRGVNERGRDVGLFKQLDGALKKNDAVKEAEKQRKAAEEREKERARKEDERNKAIKDIDTRIKSMEGKMEV